MLDTFSHVFRITGFSDFVHHLVFKKLKSATFLKLDLFLSSGEWGDTYSVGFLRKSYPQSSDLFILSDDGQSLKTQ
jgi:hypothetical protein